MTTRHELRQWFDEGKATDAAFMVVWADTFDNSHYPVYYRSAQAARDDIEVRKTKEMTKVMEAYDLAQDRDEQINREYCWELPRKLLVDTTNPAEVAERVAFEEAQFDVPASPLDAVLIQTNLSTMTSSKVTSVETLLAQLRGLVDNWERRAVASSITPTAVTNRTCARELRAVLDGHS